MRKSLKYILPLYKALPLLLFVWYYYNITFCLHIHIIDGVTVVHSHPYTKTSNGKPNHTHNAAQIQLIAAWAHFIATDDFTQVELTAPNFSCQYLYIETSASLHIPELIGQSSLRAPPAKA